MLKLIHLEWQKNRLNKYVIYAALCTVITYVCTVLMAVLSINEGEMMFEDYQSFSSFIHMLLRIVFHIFSAILLVRLIIDEYTSKTIGIMFTCPVSRKKLLAAKMLLAGCFSAISIFISSLLYGLLTLWLQNIIMLYETNAVPTQIIQEILPNLTTAIMTAGMAYISLYFGMRKLSTSSAITSAVMISLLLNGSFSSLENAGSLFENIFIPLALSLAGAIIGYMSWHNIETNDL